MSQKPTCDKKSSQNVVFKRKTTSFSMIANPIIDDKNITPAAGWLYVTIQRWITFNSDDFVCSKAFIASKFQSGYRMFNRAWDELKENGYLKMYSHPTEGWQAELLDQPQPDTPHTYYLDITGELKSTNIDRAEKKAAKLAEERASDHYPQNDTNGDHYPQNDSNGFDRNGNGSNNIKTLNNNSYNTPLNSIHPLIQKNQDPSANDNDRLIGERVINQIKEQIDYDTLSSADEYQWLNNDDLNMAVDLLAEMATASSAQKIGQNNYAPEHIRDRVASIDQSHIEYVFDCFYQNKSKVFDIRSYLKTALFNAPSTIKAFYTNQIRSGASN